MIPALVLVAVILVAYLPFLAHLPGPARTGFMLSGIIYVSGAIGIELAGGYVADRHPENAVLRGGFKTVEEFLEMSGIALFISTLLRFRRPDGDKNAPAPGPDQAPAGR